MTLRQSNGQASSCVSTIAWPSSAVGASSSSSSTAVTSIACVEIQNSAEHSTRAAKKHYLVDQKRRQWAEERAEQEEWYPFGRPGGGAPLKSPSERLSQQRLRRLNNTAPANSRYSDGGASNGSITEFSGLNNSQPVYCQISAENHCANGRLQQQQAQTLPDPTTLPTSFTYGSSGYYAPYSGVVMSYPAPVAADSSCQTCPTVGAMASLPNQPTSGAHHVQYSPMALPGAVTAPVGDSTGHPDIGKHFALVSPYPHQQYYGYAAQGMAPVAHRMQDPSQGFHVLAPLAPAPVFPTDSSVVSGGRNSLTASTASPPYPPQMATAPLIQVELQRPGMSHHGSGPALGSYTEQWANQLPLWQENEPHSPVHPRPNNLPVTRQYASHSNGAAASCPDSTAILPSPQQLPFQSPAGPQQPQFLAANASTPVVCSQHPTAMAWVTPIQAKPDNLQRVTMVQQRTAVVSPLHSKAPSLSGNETLDGSANLQFMSASFTGSVPGGGDDSGIHRRRADITGLKGERDSEEKQIKMLEHKMALEEQLMEKRRKQLIEEERERREAERAERERRLIEEREALENEQERNRWRKLAEQEEKREELIMGPLQRAEEEGRRVRHSKLLRHASCGRQSESDGYESMSPPAATQSNASSHGQPLAAATNQGEDVAAPFSSGPTVASVPRSQSLPPPAPAGPVPESPGDDRPIRPLTKDPLKIWEEMGYAALGEDATSNQQRKNAPVRQSLRKSRSTEATKLEAARRAESLERKRTTPQGNREAPNGDAKVAIQNGKPTKSKQIDAKEAAVDHKGSFNDRLKSAGLISNATFIIDSKGNELDEKKHETKAKHVSKKKTSYGMAGLVPANSASDSAKTPESSGKPKLLGRRPTAEKPVLLSAVNDNPWGNTLGGLNPLLQPIVTRRRKPRPSLPTPTAADDPERKLLEETTTAAAAKTMNGNTRMRSDSMTNLFQRTSESDTNNNEAKKADSKGVNGTSTTVAQVEQKPSKPTCMRAPSLDRFNARSPLYGSISAKIKRPTEYQNKLMEQLGLLRQQLKKKQKEVEDGLKSPSQVSASTRD